MKGLGKRALAVLLVLALLVGVGGIPASAGLQATYPPHESQFVNKDGWKLISFEANGPHRYSALGWANMPTIVGLQTVWERDGETVTRETDSQVVVAPGTFTWSIEDESIAQLIPAQELPPDMDMPTDFYTSGIHALIFCLREGKTVITVTGPHGKISKCGLVVMPEETSDPVQSDNGFTNDEAFTTGDGWTIMSFSLDLNREALNQEMGVGDTGTLQIHSSWWRQIELVPETVSGYLNFAPEAFEWSVSDESIAVLRDDYPGTTARTLVALAEGYVTVTVTGPLGKWFTKQIYVLPIDDFKGGNPNDPKPPEFDDPRPWGFDIGTWVADLVVNAFISLLRPIVDAANLMDDTGELGERLDGWLDRVGGRLGEWIKWGLWPVEQAVEWVVDMASSVVEWAVSQAEETDFGWKPLGQALAVVASIFQAVFEMVFGTTKVEIIGGEEQIYAPNGFGFGIAYSTGDISGDGILFVPPSEAAKYIKRAEGSNKTLDVLKTALSAAIVAVGGYLISKAAALAPLASALLKLGLKPIATKVIGGVSGLIAGYIFDQLIGGNASERIGAMKLCAQNGSGFILTKNGVYEWSPSVDRGYGKYPYIKLSALSRL